MPHNQEHFKTANFDEQIYYRVDRFFNVYLILEQHVLCTTFSPCATTTVWKSSFNYGLCYPPYIGKWQLGGETDTIPAARAAEHKNLTTLPAGA